MTTRYRSALWLGLAMLATQPCAFAASTQEMTQQSNANAVISAYAEPGNAPITITLSAANSSSGLDGIVGWHWLLSDGREAEGEEAQFQMDQAGNFDVTLTITTTSGESATATQTLTIVDTSDDESEPAVTTHQTRTLRPSDDVGAGRNGYDNQLRFSQWNHGFIRFDLAGISQPVLKAELVMQHLDNFRGQTSAWAAASDQWNEAGGWPMEMGQDWLGGKRLAKATAGTNGEVVLDVTDYIASEAGGDGVAAIELSNNHNNWKNYGSRENASSPLLRLTLGGTATTSATSTPTIEVVNVAPAARFSAGQPDSHNALFWQFDASNSSDTDGNVEQYTWTIGGDTFTGSTLDYHFASSGNHAVTLDVVDSAGATASLTKTISFSDAVTEMAGTAEAMVLMPLRDVGANKQFGDSHLQMSLWDHAFIAFDISALAGQQVETATLNLYVQKSVALKTSAWYDPSFVWSQTSLAPSRNAVASKGLLADAGNHSDEGWVTLNMSNALNAALEKGQKELVVELATNYGGWIPYGASESQRPPRLEINGATTTGMNGGSSSDMLMPDSGSSTADMDSDTSMDMGNTTGGNVDMHIGNGSEMNMGSGGSMNMGTYWGYGFDYGPDIAQLLRNTGSGSFDVVYTGEQPRGSHDGTGSFRNVCEVSHFSYDDPIVKPGQVAATHLHMFFGNTLTNAYSTYQSLRSSGNSTCRGGTANRTAYWMPAMLDANGQVQIPEKMDVYYKTGYNGTSPSRMQVVPDGLRMVAGAAMATSPQSGQIVNYQCSAYSKNANIIDCADTLIMEVTFPQCWDGKNLDSADHKSHMAYPSNGCPATHPVQLPVIAFKAIYKTGGGSKGWRLSSDMYEGKPMGYSAHADWFEAWDPEIKKVWTKHCLNNAKDCGSHILGDGRVIR